MQNDQSTLMAPALTPKKSRKKLFIFGGIGALIVLLLGVFVIPAIIKQVESSRLNANLPYVYLPEMKGVDPKGDLKFSVGFTPEKSKDSYSNPYTNYIQVYSDAAFTKPAIDVLARYSDTNGKKITIAPNPSTGLKEAYNVKTKKKESLAQNREWGIHEKYYVVQYVDFNSGKKLEKPIVQPFTVARDLSAPQVSTSFDEKGNLSLKWDKVEGATEYIVARIDHDESIGDATIYETLDSNTTSWSTTAETNSIDGFSQNRILSAGVYSQDSNVGTVKQEEFTRKDNVDIAVFAATSTAVSSYESLDTLSLRAQAPSGFATNTARALNIEVAGEVTNITDIPANVPVILSDGSTAMQAIDINPDTIRISDRSLFNTETGRYITTLDIPYTVRGTNLAWTYRVTNFNTDNYKQQLASVLKTNEAKLVKTGTASFEQLDAASLPAVAKAATTRPSVPYKVNASNEFVDYIAANLMNGAEAIDVSRFVNSQSIQLSDALQEAINQNPYIMYVSGYSYLSDKRVLQIRYSVDKETRDKKAKELNDKVKSIVNNVIKAGMSTSEKVTATNTYIIDNATYNYNALKVKDSFLSAAAQYADAWTAYGTLFDGTAVCGGYAFAFKALADEAGVENVYVTGFLDNTNRHAWNKVKIDGAWRVVDTTWNDSNGERNKYLMITDKQAESQRSQVEDSAWISDPFLKAYAAV